MVESILYDVKYAIRSYAKAPAFTLAVVATLALGIGASTAIFSLVDGILLEPLPLPEPDRLVYINETGHNGTFISTAWPNYLDWRVRQRVQRRHDPAAKFLDLGERMHLAAVVHRQEMLADHQIRVGRSHVPRTDRPETHKLLDEVLERDASVPNARAGARTCRRRRVEGVRIARIHQVHHYIA